LSLLDNYLAQAKELLPKGALWKTVKGGRLWGILNFTAGQTSTCHSRIEKLIMESDPETASELLSDWEEFAGLPDECSPLPEGQTITERQEAVVEKLTGRGSMSVARFYEIARKMGYEITIREYRPFTCGRSVCGGPDQLGDTRARFWWRVTIHGPRAHYFRTGRNRAGDRLGWASPAIDLECFFNRRKPAHTTIIFEYQEIL